MRVPVCVTDAELERIGKANPGYKVELVDGEVLMSPTNADAGRRSMVLAAIVKQWADAHGYIAFDSSTGFRTGSKSVLSPDASLIERTRWESLSEPQKRSFGPVPDIVIELISSRHDARADHAKCARWHDSGAAYVLALNPYGKPKFRSWGSAPADFPTDWSAVVD